MYIQDPGTKNPIFVLLGVTSIDGFVDVAYMGWKTAHNFRLRSAKLI